MAKMITEYIRRGGSRRYASVYVDGKMTDRKKQTTDKGGHKIGMMIAVVGDDGKVHIGWSRCNKMDTFNPERGYVIAFGRAFSDNSDTMLAASMVKKMHKFIERVKRCYKDKEVVLSFSFPAAK